MDVAPWEGLPLRPLRARMATPVTTDEEPRMFTLRILTQLASDVRREEWDALVGDESPFLEWPSRTPGAATRNAASLTAS